jgi:hypothetical protein
MAALMGSVRDSKDHDKEGCRRTKGRKIMQRRGKSEPQPNTKVKKENEKKN